MLEAVDRAGSIKQAAHDLGKSYRYVWGRIKAAEKVLGCQLVATQVGGKDVQRSCLSSTARQLVDDFRAVRSRVIQLTNQEFARRFGQPVLDS
jgi:molybdate transport system regulatory protein